jgi:SAM-dependent methyltransferase
MICALRWFKYCNASAALLLVLVWWVRSQLKQSADDAPGHWSESAQVTKYAERAKKGQCNAGGGMWGGDYSESYWCWMEWAGREHYAVGDRVLDWGSGCGHKATWMRIHFGVDVYGLDLEAGAVEWANNHSLGHFCATDGSKLEFLADQSFDHVFSVAAIYHLPYEVQCDVLQQFLRVIVDGGTISIMWNGNHLRDRPSKWPALPWWRSCVAGSPWPSSSVSIAEEKTEVIGNFQLGLMDEDSFARRM